MNLNSCNMMRINKLKRKSNSSVAMWSHDEYVFCVRACLNGNARCKSGNLPAYWRVKAYQRLISLRSAMAARR